MSNTLIHLEPSSSLGTNSGDSFGAEGIDRPIPLAIGATVPDARLHDTLIARLHVDHFVTDGTVKATLDNDCVLSEVMDVLLTPAAILALP
jgi:hypothetical protein